MRGLGPSTHVFLSPIAHTLPVKNKAGVGARDKREHDGDVWPRLINVANRSRCCSMSSAMSGGDARSVVLATSSRMPVSYGIHMDPVKFRVAIPAADPPDHAH